MTKILVVDDEPALRDTVSYALRQEGFEVELRPDGESGLAAALENGFDLVILDLMLPGLPGTEVCRRLRAESAVPIVMLTAKNAELDRTGVGEIRRVGNLELDPVRHRVRVDDEQVSLTPSEFRLLDFLARDPDRVFSRKEIMQHLWDSSYVGDQRACDIHISNLRRKVEADPSEPKRIVTVRGIGYKLVAV